MFIIKLQSIYCIILTHCVITILAATPKSITTTESEEEEEEDEDEITATTTTTTKKVTTAAATAAAAAITTIKKAAVTEASKLPEKLTTVATKKSEADIGEGDLDVELNKSLENINDVINSIVKEGSNIDMLPSKGDDEDTVTANKLLKIVQDMTKIFAETNDIPDDNSPSTDDDKTKLLSIVQEILKYFFEDPPADPNSPDAKYEGDITENILKTIDDILKTLDGDGGADTAITTEAPAGVTVRAIPFG